MNELKFNSIVLKNDDETEEQYKYRLCSNKADYDITWQDIADLIETQCGLSRSEAYYRKWYKAIKEVYVEDDKPDSPSETSTIEDKLIELQKQKMKLSDERVQNNAILRRLSREETLKEIAKECVANLKELPLLENRLDLDEFITSQNCGILCLSDWHYGMDFSLFNNVYNTSIAAKRLNKLLDEVQRYIITDDLKELYVLNLGDLISGRIHLTLRLQSRIDTITQTMEVCELLSDFLHKLSANVKIHYYDCLDNHSRVEPNKKDSLNLESFARLIPWWLRERLQGDIKENRVEIHDNEYDWETITFNCNGFRMAGVHGHEYKPTQIIDNLSLYTHETYDLVLTSHTHHFSCEEKNETIIVCNGSMMGTDDYARKLHLSSTPSQNLIIVTPDNVIESIHRIILW